MLIESMDCYFSLPANMRTHMPFADGTFVTLKTLDSILEYLFIYRCAVDPAVRTEFDDHRTNAGRTRHTANGKFKVDSTIINEA